MEEVGDLDDDFDWDLEMELLCLPSSGGSVRQMQRLAARISQSCTDVPQHVVELGNLPAASHRERSMHRWVQKQPWRKLLPEPYTFGLPYTSNHIDETAAEQSVLLPHETFATVAQDQGLFEMLFKGPPGALEHFWERTSTTTWFQRHPLLAELSAQPGLCIPIGLHGDDGGVYGQSNSVLILTWGSVVQELVTLDSRILFAGVLLNTAVPGKTMEALYKVFVWSLNCLAAGVWPECDHTGRPFSEDYMPKRYALRGQRLHQTGLRGVWSELRGDWKWQMEALHLDQHYNTNYICHLCRAHSKIERLWFTQFGRASRLRKTLVRWSSFRNWYEDRYERPPFFDIIGFDIWRCWCDAMHCLDLGVYQSVAASCLCELVREGVWGHIGDDGYKLAHIEYKGWCSARGLPPAPRFEKSRLVKSGMDFPKFTQQSAKASATRYILRWLRELLQRPGLSESPHGRVRRAMMDAFVGFEDLCERHGRWVPPLVVAQMADCMEAGLLHMHALAAEASGNGLFFWHLTPKCHMATHLAYDFLISGVNPRRTTCYADEDMVGRCKKIVQKSHGKTAARSLVLRYAILVCTRWWTKLRELRGLRAG